MHNSNKMQLKYYICNSFILLIILVALALTNLSCIKTDISKKENSEQEQEQEINLFDILYGDDLLIDALLFSKKYNLSEKKTRELLFLIQYKLVNPNSISNFKILYEIDSSEVVTYVDSTLYNYKVVDFEEYFSKLSEYFQINEETMADIMINYKKIIINRERD